MRLALLLLAIPTLAHADTIRIGKNSEPVVTPYLQAKTDQTRVYDRGWKKCDPGGGAYTTQQPMLEWDLTEQMELRIRLENQSGGEAGGGGIIVVPDGTYVCDDNHNQFWIKDWPKGHYKLFLSSSTIGVGAVVRIENPTSVGGSLTKALDKLPSVELDKGKTNPAFHNLPAQVIVDAGDAGKTCGKKGERIMPLAKLVVGKEAPWYVDIGRDEGGFIQTEDGHCAHLRESSQLPAGTHTLWAIVPTRDHHNKEVKPPTSFALEVDDRSAPLSYPEARKQFATTLDDPLVVDGKVRAAESWGSRNPCRGAARAPDFYLTSDKPLQKVSVSLLWSTEPQELHIYGPIERVKASSTPQCGNTTHEFDVFEGSYAVWVGGNDKAAGTDYHVLVMRAGTKVDAMATLVPVPAELSMADRALHNHYPYFRGGKLDEWTTMFTKAPDQLFVYTRTDVDKIPAGEPLLVQFSNDTHTAVYRDDGTSAQIDTRLVTTQRPDTVVLPKTPRVPEVTSLEQAISDAGAEDDKAIAAYRKIDDKYSSCMGDYLSKNDPTWGHDSEVYRVDGNGNVVNVSDQVSRAAQRYCGASSVDAAANKLEKQLATTRTARYKAHLAAVRKRFGL